MNCQSHWHALIAPSSCRCVWDARGLSIKEINNQRATHAGLMSTFKSIHRFSPNHIATKGDFDADLSGREPVLIADVKLIIRYDGELYYLHFRQKSEESALG